MRRLSTRRRRQRIGSMKSGVNEPSLPSGWPTSTAIWLTPAGSRTTQPTWPATRSLAGGAVVRTALVARLFGLRLLTVEGSVLLIPQSFSPPPPMRSPLRAPPRANATPPRVPPDPVAARSQWDGGIGSRLGASARLINESVEGLRE